MTTIYKIWLYKSTDGVLGLPTQDHRIYFYTNLEPTSASSFILIFVFFNFCDKTVSLNFPQKQIIDGVLGIRTRVSKMEWSDK